MTTSAIFAVLRRKWAEVASVFACAAVVGLFLHEILAGAGAFGLPLDDSYIYLTYARQFARGRPFTYFDGSGYSAGATSALWPMVIAPLWGIGFREQKLPLAVFALGAILLTVSALLCCAIGRRTVGAAGGFYGAVMMLTCGPLVWGYLSGMEVGLAGTALLAAVWFLVRDGIRPSVAVLLSLAAATLSRPEVGVWATIVVLAAAGASWRRGERMSAARFLLALGPALIVACLNRALAGHFVPNTAVAKSHFYQPGFDLAYFADTLVTQGRALVRALVGYDGAVGPLPYPYLVAVFYLAGARQAWLAVRRDQSLAFGVAALLAAPVMLWVATLLSSAQWAFQNYRYISASFAPLMLVGGMAFAPGGGSRVPPVVRAVVAAAVFWLLGAAMPSLRVQARLFAQGALDTNAQVVAIGTWIRTNVAPGETVAVHDVGAIGYFGQRPLLDVIGLITNHRAEHCNEGPGSRFESLERLAPPTRPRYFAYYPGWLLAGAGDLFGPVLFTAELPPAIGPRLAGDSSMSVFVADWRVAGSGEAPLARHAGFVVRDALDVADLESERQHGYVADHGPRGFGDRTERFSVYYSGHDDPGRTNQTPRGEPYRIFHYYLLQEERPRR